MATISGSVAVAPMSSRSSVIVQGSTMSAWRAVAVQAVSWTTKVSSAQGRGQALQILMVVEGAAPGPVGQPDVRVAMACAVVVEGRAGVEQHVADARDGNEVAHAIAALRQSRGADRVAALAIVGQRAQRVVVAAAGQAQLAQRGRQHGAHPDRLLTVLGALQRMRDHHQHAPAVQRLGQRAQARRVDAAQRRRPVCGFGAAIAAAYQVVLEHRQPSQ